MIKKLIIAAASVAAISSAAYGADEYEKFGEANGWTVWANKTSGGCFLENRNNNGNTVQMGLATNKDKLAFLGVWNNTAPIMEKGETRDMNLDIDGKGYTFQAKANEGTVSEGLTGGYMYLNNPDFISDIENGKVMTIHATADGSFEVDLTGTKKGIAMARECFQAQNG